jgi:Family of unknown function (DUF5681)
LSEQTETIITLWRLSEVTTIKTKPVKVHASASTVPKQLTPWKPGQSGNPAGRPVGSRQRFSESVIQDIAADWAIGGAETIARVRQTDPATYFRVVASILPKDVLVNVQQSTDNILPEDRQLLVELLRMITAAVPTGVDTTSTLEFLADALRAHFAKPVEQ